MCSYQWFGITNDMILEELKQDKELDCYKPYNGYTRAEYW